MTISKKIKAQVNGLIINYQPHNQSKTLNKLKQIILADNPTMGTQTVRYSIIKKMFRQKTNDTIFLNKIKPSPEITKYVLRKNLQIRDNRKLIL